MEKINITCFKAYDARGRVPEELNEDIAWRIGRAYAAFTGAKRCLLYTSPSPRD